MPTYTNLTCNQKARLHKVLMRTARMSLNSYCYKKSIDYILWKCNWVDIDKMIKLTSLKFINNMLLTKKPGYLFSQLKLNKRASPDNFVVSEQKSEIFQRSPKILSVLLSWIN